MVARLAKSLADLRGQQETAALDLEVDGVEVAGKDLAVGEHLGGEEPALGVELRVELVDLREAFRPLALGERTRVGSRGRELGLR